MRICSCIRCALLGYQGVYSTQASSRNFAFKYTQDRLRACLHRRAAAVASSRRCCGAHGVIAAVMRPDYRRYDSFIAFVQTTIEAEGFRSLREGEEVEFVIEPSEDNRFKAVKVTGPDGAPPQVHQDRSTAELSSLVSLNRSHTASLNQSKLSNVQTHTEQCAQKLFATCVSRRAHHISRCFWQH